MVWKKYLILGWLEQPRQNKNLFDRHDKPKITKQERNPFGLSSLSPHSPQFQTVSRGHPSLVSLKITNKRRCSKDGDWSCWYILSHILTGMVVLVEVQTLVAREKNRKAWELTPIGQLLWTFYLKSYTNPCIRSHVLCIFEEAHSFLLSYYLDPYPPPPPLIPQPVHVVRSLCSLLLFLPSAGRACRSLPSDGTGEGGARIQIRRWEESPGSLPIYSHSATLQSPTIKRPVSTGKH